jgi:hypothetical protein
MGVNEIYRCTIEPHDTMKLRNAVLLEVHTIFRLVATVTNIITYTSFIYVTEVTQRPTENNSEHTARITHFRSF